MALTGRFTVLVALGAVPLVLLGDTVGAAWGVLAGWVVLCALLASVDLWLAASPRTLGLARELPARVRLGESVASVLLVGNQGRRMLRAVVRDAWQPSAGPSTARQRVIVPGGERRALTLTLTPTRRGERRVEQVTVRSFGPLGLAARQSVLAAPGAVRVLPPFLSRRHVPSRLARLRELDGRTAVRIRGQGTEFDSLREYVRGDDVRSIDWRASARATTLPPKLVVRTWRPERDRRIVVVVDSSRTSAARIGDEPRLDTAIEAALLLSVIADRAGDRVDLLAYDRRVRARVHGASGAELLSQEVDALASVSPELIEMDWRAVPGQVRALTAQRALVVLLTSLDSIGAAQGLLAVLGQLTATHTVLVASVTDPVVAEAARRLDDRAAVYRAAAAERALLDTARLGEAVRGLGAHVVTGTPEALPPAVTDAYLALKAAGRL
ncbi:DUF58 domain-containing protein [Gryllotalpicola protaetiae]|uniref:DUF58 domain-containing protein n=1 Tax=Gryllotalpicola protaetiae TaxID=2419771 RepID=A0A387BTC5_9MICO|nr:DUF58 domain-containing protein [Gryllotalpicola protaetiae]AYG04299.1 DUF58 domain-containing protein [Gryllotalpicola protaetiae]